jgi:Skp family chaperone for outer membrane proteins
MMSAPRLIIVLAVCAAAATAGWVSAAAQPRRPNSATTVAVVDLDRVFEQSLERAQIKKQFQLDVEAANKAVKQSEEKIKQLRFQLESLLDRNKNPKQYDRIESQMSELLVERAIRSQADKAQYTRTLIRSDRDLYFRILDQCAAVARDGGYQLVLFKEPPKLADVANHPQLASQFGARKVLWAADELDITDKVVARINGDWKAQGG